MTAFRSEDKICRGFHHTSQAWYARAVMRGADWYDEVTFGDYPEGGGTVHGEMAMRWYTIGYNEAGGRPTGRLEVYADSWRLLATFSDVIAALGQRDKLTPEEFCALLREHGFQDRTQRERP